MGRHINTDRLSILVVDDEETFLEFEKETLERAGYMGTGLTSGDLAFRMISVSPTKFDAVIVDEKMDGISGTDLAKRILEARPDLPVILFTDFP